MVKTYKRIDSNNVLNVLELFLSTKSVYKEYVYCILANLNAIKYEIALDGAKIINESPNEFNAEYASEVIRNLTVVDSKKVLEYAKMLNKVLCEDKADLIFEVLSSTVFIKLGINYLLASELIASEKEDYNTHVNIDLQSMNVIIEELISIVKKLKNKGVKIYNFNNLLTKIFGVETIPISNMVESDSSTNNIPYIDELISACENYGEEDINPVELPAILKRAKN